MFNNKKMLDPFVELFWFNLGYAKEIEKIALKKFREIPTNFMEAKG
jgi:hypothetical protein